MRIAYGIKRTAMYRNVFRVFQLEIIILYSSCILVKNPI
jgi:hypothetical protein